MDFAQEIATILAQKENASIHIQTLGQFQVTRNGEAITPKAWGRDKTVQLFQFLVTARHRRALHKEQIIDRIWEDIDPKGAEQTFKVALHGINKVLEPNRPPRTDPKYIVRQGHSYQLRREALWIDTEIVEALIKIGNQAYINQPTFAQTAYRAALQLYAGVYLPNRMYEDWTTVERERIQTLVIGTMITLGELCLSQNPLESIRLAQEALLIDHAWEDAYRLQMQAYANKGNRPMVIKTYRQCQQVLDEEFGIEPLPETKRLFQKVQML